MTTEEWDKVGLPIELPLTGKVQVCKEGLPVVGAQVSDGGGTSGLVNTPPVPLLRLGSGSHWDLDGNGVWERLNVEGEQSCCFNLKY